MANWLERAKREIQKTPYRPTAKTDKTLVMAVSAVPQPGESRNLRASTVSNGSIYDGPAAEAEEISPALAAAYRRFWSLPESEPMEAFQAANAKIVTLETQAEPVTAWRTLEAAARAWYQEKGVCPFCKLSGVLHLEHMGQQAG